MSTQASGSTAVGSSPCDSVPLLSPSHNRGESRSHSHPCGRVTNRPPRDRGRAEGAWRAPLPENGAGQTPNE